MRSVTKLTTVGIAACLLVSTAQPTLAARSPTLARRAAKSLGLHCSKVTSRDGVRYAKCTGEIRSFDGIRLDTDLSIPLGARRPHKTIVMLHGWSQDKTTWEAVRRAGDGRDKWHWNNVWFVSRGWVVVNYTSRGFKDSCGQYDNEPNCSRGYTRLALRRFEVRDTKYLLGKLVDARIARARRLVATGDSYGGGQSWLLATSLPWKSPKGRKLQLRAAVPKYGWTDLLYSLGPNGRATSGRNQSRSHLKPFGIPKYSYINALYAVGRGVGEGRYDSDPNHPGTNLDMQYVRVMAGEPYNYDDPVLRAMVASYRRRSAYYARAYLHALRQHTVRPVPVMSIQGWTDPLFPAVETLQMFRKLKAADRGYPIRMVFADVGHFNAQNPSGQWRPTNRLANRFLEAYVLGHRAARPRAQSYSFRTRCPGTPKRQLALTGKWGALAPGVATASSSVVQVISSSDQNPGDGAASDPIANQGCITESSGTTDPGGAYWTFRPHGVTLVGLPRVRLRYHLQGTDAALALKLWDVAPDGTKTLVTRGAYRLSTAAGDKLTGTLVTQLFGNHWRFERGHRVTLQVTESDSPFLRRDNLPSTVELTSVRLVLPTRQPGSRALPAA